MEQSLEDDDRIAEFYRRKELCRTLANNRCDVITITAPSSDIHEMRAKRGVVITARVHPGETNSSWMMEVREVSIDHQPCVLAIPVLGIDFVLLVIPVGVGASCCPLTASCCPLTGFVLPTDWLRIVH